MGGAAKASTTRNLRILSTLREEVVAVAAVAAVAAEAAEAAAELRNQECGRLRPTMPVFSGPNA